jgi:hypothetical protein
VAVGVAVNGGGAGDVTEAVGVAVGGLDVLVGGTEVNVGGAVVIDAVMVNVNVGVMGVCVGVGVNVDGWKGVTDGGRVNVTEGVALGPRVAVNRFGVGDNKPALVGIIRVRVGVPVSVRVGVAVRAPGRGTIKARPPRQ